MKHNIWIWPEIITWPLQWPLFINTSSFFLSQTHPRVHTLGTHIHISPEKRSKKSRVLKYNHNALNEYTNKERLFVETRFLFVYFITLVFSKSLKPKASKQFVCERVASFFYFFFVRQVPWGLQSDPWIASSKKERKTD